MHSLLQLPFYTSIDFIAHTHPPLSNSSSNSIPSSGSPSLWPYIPPPLPWPSFNEMLSHSDTQATSDSSSATAGHTDISPPGPSSDDPPSLRHLLFSCALSICQGLWPRSLHLLNTLSQRASSHGDANERVVSLFVDSLTAYIVLALGERQVASQLIAPRFRTLDNIMTPPPHDEIQGAFLFFNQVSPFLRFSHLTANQAILEALEGWDGVHIVDMEIMQGVQWPPLLQALAERASGPPRVRISGIGENRRLLAQTGNWLTSFAASLGLPMFEFDSIQASNIEDLSVEMLQARPGEALAINCIPRVRHMRRNQASFVSLMSYLQPTIITVAEREANYKQGACIDRFMEAFQHYAAVFESLEATLPPTSAERSSVENVWLRGEIMSVVAANEGSIMDTQYSKWREVLRDQAFNAVPHSAFALSQARLLLRLRYPSEGFTLQEGDDCLVLGWQDAPLFGVSAWS